MFAMERKDIVNGWKRKTSSEDQMMRRHLYGNVHPDALNETTCTNIECVRNLFGSFIWGCCWTNYTVLLLLVYFRTTKMAAATSARNEVPVEMLNAALKVSWLHPLPLQMWQGSAWPQRSDPIIERQPRSKLPSGRAMKQRSSTTWTGQTVGFPVIVPEQFDWASPLHWWHLKRVGGKRASLQPFVVHVWHDSESELHVALTTTDKSFAQPRSISPPGKLSEFECEFWVKLIKLQFYLQ